MNLYEIRFENSRIPEIVEASNFESAYNKAKEQFQNKEIIAIEYLAKIA